MSHKLQPSTTGQAVGEKVRPPTQQECRICRGHYVCALVPRPESKTRMDSLASGLNWTRLLLVFTGTGLYLHLPGGARLKTETKSKDPGLSRGDWKIKGTRRHTSVRTGLSSPFSMGMERMSLEIGNELRWGGERAWESQGHPWKAVW